MRRAALAAGVLTALAALVYAGVRLGAGASAPFSYDMLQPGDLVFVAVRGNADFDMQTALTGGRFHHVGVVFVDRGRALQVVESRGVGVRVTRAGDFIALATGGFCVKRLAPGAARAPLDGIADELLREVGKSYDRDYDWSTDWSLYNAEFVAKVFERGYGVRLYDERTPLGVYGFRPDRDADPVPFIVGPDVRPSTRVVFVETLFRARVLLTVYCTP